MLPRIKRSFSRQAEQGKVARAIEHRAVAAMVASACLWCIPDYPLS
jgi:hypothetical protein